MKLLQIEKMFTTSDGGECDCPVVKISNYYHDVDNKSVGAVASLYRSKDSIGKNDPINQKEFSPNFPIQLTEEENKSFNMEMLYSKVKEILEKVYEGKILELE